MGLFLQPRSPYGATVHCSKSAWSSVHAHPLRTDSYGVHDSTSWIFFLSHLLSLYNHITQAQRHLPTPICIVNQMLTKFVISLFKKKNFNICSGNAKIFWLTSDITFPPVAAYFHSKTCECLASFIHSVFCDHHGNLIPYRSSWENSWGMLDQCYLQAKCPSWCAVNSVKHEATA